MTAGSVINVVYKSPNTLSCMCGGGDVIVCVDAAKTSNGAPFIEGTLLASSPGFDVCGNCQYTYYINYNDGQLLNPLVPLVSADITGVICRGCLTSYLDWKAPFTKPLLGADFEYILPAVLPNANDIMVVTSISGNTITLGWSPPP